jgi:single-stranded DNA-binding protein
MGSMANTVVAGNLARTPVLKEVQGQPVIDLTIMVNLRERQGKNPDGSANWGEVTYAYELSIWRERAGVVAGWNLSQGTYVVAWGEPHIRTYEKDGETRFSTVLERGDYALGPKSEGGNGESRGSYPQRRNAGSTRSNGNSGRGDVPLDLPADEDIFPPATAPAKAGAKRDW